MTIYNTLAQANNTMRHFKDFYQNARAEADAFLKTLGHGCSFTTSDDELNVIFVRVVWYA